MSFLRATVHKGRILLDEPTTLPEGTVLDLVVDDEGDNLSKDERRALHAAIAKGWEQAKAGKGRPLDKILRGLPARP